MPLGLDIVIAVVAAVGSSSVLLWLLNFGPGRMRLLRRAEVRQAEGQAVLTEIQIAREAEQDCLRRLELLQGEVNRLREQVSQLRTVVTAQQEAIAKLTLQNLEQSRRVAAALRGASAEELMGEEPPDEPADKK